MHREIKMRDYFCDNPIYDDVQFRTCFKMSRRLFLKVIGAVFAYVSYIIERFNVACALRLSSIQKCVAANHILGYDVLSNATDAYTRAPKSVAMESMISLFNII